MEFKWENLENKMASGGKVIENTEIAKIKGGYIIKNILTIFSDSDITLSQSMVFIPDPNHEWNIE